MVKFVCSLFRVHFHCYLVYSMVAMSGISVSVCTQCEWLYIQYIISDKHTSASEEIEIHHLTYLKNNRVHEPKLCIATIEYMTRHKTYFCFSLTNHNNNNNNNNNSPGSPKLPSELQLSLIRSMPSSHTANHA